MGICHSIDKEQKIIIIPNIFMENKGNYYIIKQHHIDLGINIGALKTVYSTFSKINDKHITNVLLMNNSSRIIPSIICYTKDHRLFGENSISYLKQNLNTSYNNLSRLIGFDNSNKYEEELKYVYFNEDEINDVENNENEIIYVENNENEINYVEKNEQREIKYECIIADYLSLINEYYFEKEKYEYDSTSISVPDFYVPYQRKKLKIICESIGMKDVNLFNESSAITMYYGYNKYKDLFIEKGNILKDVEKNILFIDAGHSKTSFILSNFKYNEFKVEYVLCDPHLGGRNFNELIFNYCIEEFKKVKKIENMEITNKMRFRLVEEISKNRIKLSENKEIIIFVDSFYENEDIQIILKREKFEEIINELETNFIDNLNDIKKYVKKKKIKIDYVEIAGDLMRTPLLQNKITINKLKLCKTIITDECTSIGASLLGNFIKGKFPIKNLNFFHFNYYDISYKITTKKDNKYIDIIFKRGTVIENPIKINFFDYQDFNVDKPSFLNIFYNYNSDSRENTLFNWKINLNELLFNNIELKYIQFKVDYYCIIDFLYYNLTENLKLNSTLIEKKEKDKEEINLIQKHLSEQRNKDKIYKNLIEEENIISQKINELNEIVKNNEDLKNEVKSLKYEFMNSLNRINNFDRETFKSETFNKSIYDIYGKLYENKKKNLYEYIDKFKSNNEEINNQINEIKKQYKEKIESNLEDNHILEYNEIIDFDEEIKKKMLLIYSCKKNKLLYDLEYLKKHLPINDELNYKMNFNEIGRLIRKIKEIEKEKLYVKIYRLGEIIRDYEIIHKKIDLMQKKISIVHEN